jgi:hypothetical protein
MTYFISFPSILLRKSFGDNAMLSFDKYDSAYVIWAFILQICLIVFFAIRKSNLELILMYGWIFYLLCIPAVIVSILMLRGGKEWSFWIGGFIFLLWAIFGLIVEYGFRIQWRDPIVWPILVPYVVLYLGTIMFYWFPVGILSRPLWYLYGVLFALGTYLNITSH